MNAKTFIRIAFLLLLFLPGLSLFSQSFTEAASFTTGTDNIWKRSYTFWIDVDNDKDLDILNIETESGGISKLFINDNPGFHEGTALPFIIGDNAAIGDFDRDGYVDFIMLGIPLRFYKNNGNKTFSALPDNTIPSNITYTGESIDCGDYDNDGDLDLLHNNKVFRNNGNNTFTFMSTIIITSMSEGTSRWGDYDNDGDLDIVITGSTPDGYKSKIYQNAGNGIFNEVTGLSLAAGTTGTALWGDYDNDGDLDLIITGYNGYSYFFTAFYKNNSLNSFSQISGLPFQGQGKGSVRWGDYDNDGDLDVLFSGWIGNVGGGEYTKLYKNKGNDTFEEDTGFTFPAVGNGTAAWGDYDNDGDLDISLIGNSTTGIIAKLYRNNNTALNKIPSYPKEPQSLVNNQDVTLKWKYVDDGNTPYKGLTYNVRIGTVTTLNNLMPSNSSDNGYRSIASFGNVGHDTSVILKEIPFGTYWWSVQAIDNNFEGSPFSAEGSFLVQPLQARNLSARALSLNSLILKWERGTSDRCVVFGKESSTGIAEPVNGTSYIADGEIGFGTQIGSSGWYCLYNGRSDSVVVTGLYSDKLYSFHIFEYDGSFGSEQYLNLTGNGNPGVFGTSNFTHQSGITFGVGIYENKAVWADYNNDGYQDVLLVGDPTKLYKNGGNNTFVVVPGSEFTFPSIESGAAAWGDFDNDNDLDLVLTGNPSAPVVKIYRNNGTSGFEDIGAGITPVYYSSIACGDYDNDGDIDILMNGATGLSPNFNPVSKIYKNNSSGIFAEETNSTLTGLYRGSAKWGDYDNDGDLDIMITGISSTGLNKTEIYKNNGNGNFVLQTSTGIPGYYLSTASFGDYDNDGDLDILLPSYGKLEVYENNGNGSFQLQLSMVPAFGTVDVPLSAEWGDFNNDGYLDFLCNNPGFFTRIYLNTKGISLPDAESLWFKLYDGTLKKTGNYYSDICDYDNDGDIDILLSRYYAASDGPSVIRNNLVMKSGSYLQNSSPAASSGISAVNTPSGVTLKWRPVQTDETPKAALTYNIRIGTASSTENICPANSNLNNGYRKIMSAGNAQTDTTFFIKNLPSGNYYWSVQAVDQGCKGGAWSSTGTFEVKNVQAFFSASEVCLGIPTVFDDQSVASKGFKSWFWEFGDGTTSTSQEPEHTYATSGTFSVKLTITDTEDATDFLIKSVIVKAKPAANFTATTVCRGTSTSFSNTTNINGLSISSWSWNFGDTQSSSSSDPGSHLYSFPGNYTVSLLVIPENGCSDQISKTVTVADFPVVAISADGATNFCTGQSVNLSTSSNAQYTYEWKRDGASITGAISNSYTASISGSYTVAVTNTVGNCLTNSSPLDVTANSSPAAPLISASGPLTFCQGESVNLSAVYNSDYTYKWMLNGGEVGTGANTYTAAASGTYSLEVANISGCKTLSSNTVDIIVNSNPAVPTVSISGPTSFCQGSSVELSVSNTGGYTYQWENNSAAITNATASSYIANSSGGYTLKITNSNNCFIRTENVNVFVSESPSAPTITTVGLSTFCQDESILLSVTNTPGYSYQWKLNSGDVGSGSNTYTANASGTYNLLVTNASNCSVSSSNSIAVTVNPKPALPTVNISGPTSFCQGSSVELSVSNTAGYSYQWENNAVSVSGANFNILTANSSGVYAVKVTNANNCSIKSENVTVNVLTVPSPPSIFSASAVTFCQGDSVILSVTNTPDYSYQWRLNGGSVGLNSNSHTARTSGSYDLVISNSSGCSAFAHAPVTVTVKPLPVMSTISLTGSSKFCNGQSAILSVPVNNDYSYKWKNGSSYLGLTTNSVTVSETGIYFVEISLDGCMTSSDTVNIDVVPKPARPDINMGSYNKNNKCLGDKPLVLAVDNIVEGYSYMWHKNETPLSGKTSIEVTESANYYLEAVSDICSSERDTAVITFDEALPKPDIFAKGPVVWMLSTAAKASMYKWYYNGLTIPGATNNTYIAGQNIGTYRVAISNDGKCFYFSDNKTIPDITGIEDTDPFENVKIYPNPTTGMFTIEMNNNIFGELAIDIFTRNGSKALNIKFDKTTAHFSSQIDLSGQGKGMYLINLSLDKYRAVRKVVVE